MKTVGDAITDARTELKDVNSGNYNYSTVDMARYCGEGILELRRLRPSTRYDEDGALLDDEDTVGAWTDAHVSVEIPLHIRYYAGLVAFVIARCLSRDITDESNLAVAKTWMEKFQQAAAT